MKCFFDKVDEIFKYEGVCFKVFVFDVSVIFENCIGICYVMYKVFQKVFFIYLMFI